MESNSIELEIQRILDTEETLQGAANRILEKIANPEITDHDRFAFWNFLYQSGFYQEALISLSSRLANKNRIHWGIFIEILSRNNVDPSNSVIESTFKGLKRQNASEDLWTVTSWDKWDGRFALLRKSIAEEKIKSAGSKRENLVEKFHFLKSQRMREQAGRALKRLIFLFPEDETYRQMKSEFDEEWAREILSQRYSSKELGRVESETRRNKTEDGLVKLWFDFAQKISKKQPGNAYDFSIALQFLDANAEAVKLCEHAPTGVGPDWLIVELLFQLRRYVDVLEHLNELERKYVSDPETAFGIAYLRAQAMKALGQSASAVEILRNIVQVRPNYRSAQDLIHEWSVGAATG